MTHLPSDNIIGVTVGFLGWSFKIIFFSQVSVFSIEGASETFVAGMIAAAGGLILAFLVKWIKNKWLGGKKQ